MTRILLDPEIFITQEFGGISRYYTEVYDALENNPEIQVICPILYTDNIHFNESSLLENSYQKRKSILVKCSQLFRGYLPRKLKKKSKTEAICILEKQEFDVFVPTYYDPYFLPYIKNKPFVLTVHDMIHELYPHYFTNDKITVPNKKLLIEKAARIITVSENTKRDLLRIYPDTPASKIDIVYLAPSINTEAPIEIEAPENYILFVGNRTIYKNFIFFLKAVLPILKSRKDLFILCAGGNGFNEEENQLINESGVKDQLIQRNFKDSELAGYYKKAICFVFPSEYEGFGIPILEAMACGCPVVLTKNSSFPEVAGDAGIYFELNNASELKEKLITLLDDTRIRQEYKLKGLVQSGKFSWKITADKCLKIYQSVV
ncbi:glycosyltransferase involved in cell wall biosynthesis [Pedobacter cryoconitis]|uniref:Glycosyltransferase involved in cell wall biosynthesis n=1 Tax=Pedobacter cryoconitis TaxID=188932 RepID=A0A7W9DZK6_9SPHI|nr:glycosyltransferase family 1 protein [Pedobacter cryoconitis]MBB5635650.1 glycosyltransferase involved in cell wall biosynthesis [Pedobacter cryoconitis]